MNIIQRGYCVFKLATESTLFVFLVANSAFANPLTNATSLTWTWTAECPQGLPNNNPFNSAGTTWRNAISGHSVPLSSNDMTVLSNEMADLVWGGQDHLDNNIDTADIGFLATHGSYTLNGCTPNSSDCSHSVWLGYETSKSTDPNNDCQWWSLEMFLGNSRINYFDSFACNSLEVTWTNDFQSGSARGLHQWHGFAGTMATGSGTSTDLDDYVNAAYGGGAAYAWMLWETAYDKWAPADVCAISRTWGNSQFDATDRANNERYQDGSYPDPGWAYSKVFYLYYCDPPSPIPGDVGTWTIGLHP